MTDWDTGISGVGYFQAGDKVGVDVRLPNGAPAHLTKITGRRAGQLGDLDSVIRDLERVVKLCDRLDVGDLDELIASATWEAAVIAYGRCFNNGKTSHGKGPRRMVPNEILTGRSPKLIEAHRKATSDYRGKHVGHRIGLGEQVLIEAIRETADGPVVGIHFTSARLLRPDHSDLRALAEDLLSRLRPLFERERDTVSQELNEASGHGA